MVLSDVPNYAFDSDRERNLVASLLERYNRERGMSNPLDLAFARLADQRTSRNPIRTYLWIPVQRALAMWFTPRIAPLPYSGTIWPLREGWRQSPMGFAVTMVFALLGALYAGLALMGVTRWRENPGIGLIVAFIVIRTAFLTQLQTCEPRYVLVCLPVLLALGAQTFGSLPKAGPRHDATVRS